MPERVRITDVSPRDGLQNELGVIPTADKVRLVELLCATGVDEVEVTSFVSAKWVPQLGDAAKVLFGIYADRDQAIAMSGYAGHPSEGDVRASIRSSPVLSALVPNEKGMDDLVNAAQLIGQFQIDKASVFTAASETFSRKNTNASIAETIERFQPVIARAHSYRMLVRGYVSCAIACPFEGPIDPEKVADVATRLLDIGVDEVDFGDTIGAGTPESVTRLLEAWAKRVRVQPLLASPPSSTLHLHDTFHRAADCVKAALDLGIRSFDGSVAEAQAAVPTPAPPANEPPATSPPNSWFKRSTTPATKPASISTLSQRPRSSPAPSSRNPARQWGAHDPGRAQGRSLHHPARPRRQAQRPDAEDARQPLRRHRSGRLRQGHRPLGHRRCLLRRL